MDGWSVCLPVDGAGLIRTWFALLTAWLAGSLAWLSADRLIRDGDEEGHIGAAELLVHLLREEGVLTFAATALAGDLGEYPPLYPAVVAAWWAVVGGQPGAAVVRAVNLLWPLISAASCGLMARCLGRPALPVAALVLLIPGVCGLSRHFMPEGMLIAAVSVAALMALRAGEEPDWKHATALGVVLGAGMLVKQTFALYALFPALWALWRLRRHGLATLAAASIVAGPWYFTHLAEQSQYGQQSLQAADPGWLLAVGYYPIVGVFSELGPVLTLAVVAGAWSLRHHPSRRLGIWVGLSVVLLAVIPRRYPRLLVPLLPLLAVWAGGALTSRMRTGLVVGLASGWLALVSLTTLPSPPLINSVDEGCLQRWLRPPIKDDFGLAAVSEVVQARGAGVVVVLDAPEIPCAVQTTHGWINHLSPYLRRDGLEVEITLEPVPGAVVVDWSGGSISVPLLGRSYEIR